MDFKSCSVFELANFVTRLIKLEFKNLFEYNKIKILYKHAKKYKIYDLKIDLKEQYACILEYLHNITV